jgi:hypothetical protein
LALAGTVCRAGIAGLLRDKIWPPGKAPITAGKTAEVVRLTQAPPHEATHWTARAMAKAVRLGVATVQRIWAAHGLSPHRWLVFKLKDPAFVDKLHDIVGLYVAPPPAHAVVLSFDEKSQFQALDRTPAGTAAEEGPRRDDHPRLPAAWHDHAIRGVERPDRRGLRTEHAAPPASGVHPLPQRP